MSDETHALPERLRTVLPYFDGQLEEWRVSIAAEGPSPSLFVARAEDQNVAEALAGELVRRWDAYSENATVWLCAKCGYGSLEHGIEGHPAYLCVADMRLVPSPAFAVARADADVRELVEAVRRLSCVPQGRVFSYSTCLQCGQTWDGKGTRCKSDCFAGILLRKHSHVRVGEELRQLIQSESDK